MAGGNVGANASVGPAGRPNDHASMTDAAKAAAMPPIQQGGTGTSDDTGRAGHEPSDVSAGAAAANVGAGDHISSISKGDGVLADEPLPVGHKVFVTQTIQRGSKIVQVDDT